MAFPFTKDDVLNAYVTLKEEGIEPMQCDFVKRDENNKVCKACAISAILITRGLHSFDDTMETQSYPEMLGVTEAELWAFIDGFDGNTPSYSINGQNEHIDIYNLGRETAEAVFGGETSDNNTSVY